MSLVIGRKPGESFELKCGDHLVVVTLVRIDNGECKIAIDAPQVVDITRSELLEKKRPLRRYPYRSTNQR